MDARGTSGAQRIVQEIIGGTSNVVTTLPYIGTVTLGASPDGLAVDNFGNLLVSDFGRTSGTGHLTQIGVGQSSLTFPSTEMNASSSPQTATVTNLGDQNLDFSGISYTANFSANTSDENLCTSTTSLGPVMSCDVSVQFTPQSDGNLSTTINVTDNTQNAPGSMQQISVSGTASGVVDRTSTMLTFSPTSSPCGGTPTGTVQFQNGSMGIGNGTLSGGTATLALTLQPPYSITAVYSGDAKFLGSTSPAVTGYAPGTSTLTLTSSPDPAQLGQPVTFTATIATRGGPPSAAPGGSVQFSDGNKVLGSSSIANGQATHTTSALTGGAHIIAATYTGDATCPSASATMGLIVSAPITMNITAAPLAPVYGQPVTLTVTVGATTVPAVFRRLAQVTLFLEGSTFASSNTKLGTVSLASGTATLNLSTLPAVRFTFRVNIAATPPGRRLRPRWN
jgi:Bacterial Ig-like domain (group 3)